MCVILIKRSDTVNKKCSERYLRESGNQSFKIKFKNSTVHCDICKGMPVVCEVNLKKRNMYNAQVFSVAEIGCNSVLINGQTFTHAEFANYFTLAFCMTVYKYQGGTINEPYCIYNANVMDKKELYTALSRTTRYEYLHIAKTASIYSVKEKKY